MNFKINYTILVVIAVGLLGTSGDITMTWSSPMYSKLYSNDTSINPLDEPINSNQDALIGSLINIGAIIGPFPFSLMADKFGRKLTLLCVGVPHLVAYLSFAFANSVYYFYFGRLFGGIGVGAGYALLPMYLAEISEDSNRGVISASLMVFWSFGDLLPYVIGPFLSVLVFNLILACFPLVFLILFFLFGVETPYYWLTKNREDKAEESLMYLRSLNKKDVEKELEHIRKNFKREEGMHFTDIVHNPALRKAFLISISLIALQQLGGINAIAFYLQPIFEASGSKLSSNISSVIYGIGMFFSSFIAPLVINRFGRKTLVNFSCLGTTLSLVVLGAFFYIHDSTDLSTESIFWLPLVSVISYLFFFSSGISILPWTIAAELFPTSCKQISSSSVSSSCWITSFVVTQFFNNMVALMTTAGVFWFFAAWSLFSVVFSVLFVPETKDKSFREIQDMLGS
ncbi:facilitated trehalose transporter Tret1-like [Anoplophora glabripennis]|uniref:facilitated trehalose transporter Tret1-like n=1 Tax=Anoplophora glabripennis TaxID=217634 RepID=UPI000873D14B|nr:facilitated trehalose transporter Tret1-like [Anoplophora glabripennis]